LTLKGKRVSATLFNGRGGRRLQARPKKDDLRGPEDQNKSNVAPGGDPKHRGRGERAQTSRSRDLGQGKNRKYPTRRPDTHEASPEKVGKERDLRETEILGRETRREGTGDQHAHQRRGKRAGGKAALADGRSPIQSRSLSQGPSSSATKREGGYKKPPYLLRKTEGGNL